MSKLYSAFQRVTSATKYYNYAHILGPYSLPSDQLCSKTLARCHGRRFLATKRRRQRSTTKKTANTKGTSQNRKKAQKTNAIRPPKNYLEKIPKSRSAPPAFLVSTASPYVYISQTALECEDEEEAIDPATLFSEVAYEDHGNLTLPPLFAYGDFEYFSPKTDLGYNYPTDGRPEIAFLGRSNVGKSSLINSIMRRKLCLTSRTPGRTQLPYYYGLVPKKVSAQKQEQDRSKGKDPKSAQGFIIDLPGYGYGRAPTHITEDWQKDTQDLLMHRRHEAGVLRRLFLLMDARRGMDGPNEHDRIIMRWLDDAKIPFTIVLTKADRVSVPIVVKQVNDFCLRFSSQQHHHATVAQSPFIHVTSSTQNWGIHELMVSIDAEFCAENDEDESILE